MKKFLAILLSLAIIVLSLTVVAFAAPKRKLTVSASNTTISKGDEVTVTVRLEMPTDPYKSMAFLFDYDTSVFEQTSNSDGTWLLTGALLSSYQANTKAAAIAFAAEQIANGDVFTLKLKAKTDATGGATTVTVTPTVKNGATTFPVGAASTTITVNVPATGVTLDNSTASVVAGSTTTLTATVAPAGATNTNVTWESSNTSVATVADGVVTGVAKGTATITAKTVDGSFTATCTVTVTCNHNYGSGWLNNTTQHWHECSTCNEKVDTANHVFDNACDTTCNVCGYTRTTSHDYKTTWSNDATQHWHECSVCGNKKDVANHSGGNATCKDLAECSVCGKTYGTYAGHDLTKTEKVDADHTKAGNIEYYTCKDCSKIFSDAAGTNEITLADTVIPIVQHTYGDYQSNSTQHWKECGCGNIVLLANHTFDNACDTTCNVCGYTRTISHNYKTVWSNDGTQHWHECSVCGVKKDVANHTFDNACDTTCNVCGYTRTISHNYKTTWSKDGTQHWHECSVCGVKKDVANHTGGTATCKDLAVCSTCSASYGQYAGHDYTEVVAPQYIKTAANCNSPAVYYKSCSVCHAASETLTFTNGEKDTTNHVGNTEIKNKTNATCETAGNTGDTYCVTCHNKISDGTVIPVIPHNVTNWKVETPATAESTGVLAGECSICHKKITVLIDKLSAEAIKVLSDDGVLSKEIKIEVDKTNLPSNVVFYANKTEAANLSDAQKKALVEGVTKLAAQLGANIDISTAKAVGAYEISSIIDEATTIGGDKVNVPEYPMNENVKVTAKVPAGISGFDKLALVAINADGTTKLVDFTLNSDGTVTFITTGAASYGFVGLQNTKTENPGSNSVATGDAGSLLWIAIVAVATVGLAFVVVKRKHSK